MASAQNEGLPKTDHGRMWSRWVLFFTIAGLVHLGAVAGLWLARSTSPRLVRYRVSLVRLPESPFPPNVEAEGGLDKREHRVVPGSSVVHPISKPAQASRQTRARVVSPHGGTHTRAGVEGASSRNDSVRRDPVTHAPGVLPRPQHVPATDANPSDLNLFPRGAIAQAAEPVPPLSGSALAEQRIREWAREWDAHRCAEVGDTTPEIQELARRFEAWFMPDTEVVERNVRFGIGNGAFVTRYLRAAEAYGRVPTELGSGWPAQVAHVEVVVGIDHDREGVPEHWRVLRSSGDQDFDAAALTAVRDGLKWGRKDAPAAKRPIRRSEWSFEARAYRYFVIEYTMTPGLVARGSDLSEYDDGVGKTQVIRRARLVAVVYWPPPIGTTDYRPSTEAPAFDGESG